ncbi:hypothetical protein [Nesterenkonia sandarakina]|uniref:Uncharacterized protein n=1 Tax=Nesterenkonia sandarakina TaxID=272918 RepID=A0A7Z0EB22_9MICC|nr:hypothetical protein [Nesterenkonia sandarakina]NYJ18181.1 hypothetical protein [Nesterenkonia sandarakina]
MAEQNETRNDASREDVMDPAESLRILDQGASMVRDRLQPDDRQILVAWGSSWLIGYILLWLTSDADGTISFWAFAVFMALLISAALFTAIHLGRRTAGIRGPSATSGSMYGGAWIISFIAVFVINNRLAASDLDASITAPVSFGLPVMVVAILYMAGAAIYRSRAQFVLGAWIMGSLLLSLFVEMPTAYAVMGFAGGGAMLFTSLVLHALRGRTTSRTA